MDEAARRYAETAVERLEAVIALGPEAPHKEVSEAVDCVVAFRNHAIARARTGAVSRACRDRANSLLSLAYGADFPLIGFHLHRLEQTRDGMKALLASEGGSKGDAD